MYVPDLQSSPVLSPTDGNICREMAIFGPYGRRITLTVLESPCINSVTANIHHYDVCKKYGTQNVETTYNVLVKY